MSLCELSELRAGKLFLARNRGGDAFLCRVLDVRHELARCLVINGQWEVTFSVRTGRNVKVRRQKRMCLESGTLCVQYTGEFPVCYIGNYSSAIDWALKRLEIIGTRLPNEVCTA